MADTKLNSIVFPGLDNKYIVLSTELLSQMLKDIKTNGGIAYKDELINQTEIKSQLIGSSNDKNFASDTGNKTLYAVYNHATQTAGEAKTYAQQQDQMILQQAQQDIATARAQLETAITDNLTTAKKYTDDNVSPIQQDLNTTKATVESQGTAITALNTKTDNTNATLTQVSTDLDTAKNNITNLSNSKLDKTALKIATTEEAGIVKIDGNSIVIQNGVISAVQGGEVPVGTLKCTIKTWTNSET